MRVWSVSNVYILFNIQNEFSNWMLIKFGHVLWLELIQGSKIDKIEGKQVSFRLFFFFDLTEKLDGFIIWLMRMSLWQDLTNAGVVYLCHFVQGLAGAGSQKPELLQVNIISKSTLLISNYLPFNQKLAQVEWFKWLVLDSWMLGRGLLNAYFLSMRSTTEIASLKNNTLMET